MTSNNPSKYTGLMQYIDAVNMMSCIPYPQATSLSTHFLHLIDKIGQKGGRGGGGCGRKFAN